MTDASLINNMSTITEGSVLWQPTPETVAQSNLTRYMAWLKAERGLTFDGYPDLWQWSVNEIEQFWESLWHYFGVVSSQSYESVLVERKMPGAQWFVGARLNYAENLFRQATDDRPAILYHGERQPLAELSWAKLHRQVAQMAAALRSLGVEKGDRVVAYLPNIPETIVAFLATASLGAIWSSCSPDFGSRSVLDRFSQIQPKVLLAVDGYHWNGKAYRRVDELADIQRALPSLQQTILIPQLGNDGDEMPPELSNSTALWADLLSQNEGTELTFEQVPFDHPLWVLYSSGTTGLPKSIVQSQGGILLEHLKSVHLQLDLQADDRFFWFTTTGWMMWNFLVGGLLNGNTILLTSGSPSYPDMNTLWRLAEESGMTYFGTGAAFLLACGKAGIQPNRDFDLSRLRGLGSTGSPLPVTGFEWVYENISSTLALESVSGGTDLCTAFVGGARTMPIHAGELQGPSLGAKVQAFDDAGQPVLNEVGELVITEPMPSMPIYFWNDPEMARYRASYFEMYPGVWRHGDWIKVKDNLGCVIYGRSDSTINRMGIRMGTSEIYQAVESIDEIMDSLMVDLELLGKDSYLPLFIVLREGHELTDDLSQRIKQNIRADISPRHVPNDIFVIAEVPYTLSGKKMEVPVRRILLGHAVEKAANLGAMRNPQAIDYFVEFAARLKA